MEVRTSLRKTLGVAISAATLLAIMPLGASMANADGVSDGTDLQINQGAGTTLTINASDNSAIKGHKFAALRIGTYGLAAKTTFTSGDDVNKLTGLTVNTVDDATIKSAVTEAYKSLTYKDSSNNTVHYTIDNAYTDNPVGQVAATLLGFPSSDSYITNKDETSASAPYSGKLRDLVSALEKNAAFDAEFATAPKTEAVATGTATSAVFSGLDQGLYLIKDIGATDGSEGAIPTQGAQLSVPMMVGTGVVEAGTGTIFTKFYPNTGGTELGKVNIKDDKVTFSKSIDGDNASLGQYEWGKFHLTTKVPITSGFKEYKFKMIDMPSVGLDLPALTDTAHGVKVYVKKNATDANIDSGEGANVIPSNFYTVTPDTNPTTHLPELVIDFGNSLLDHSDTFKYGYTIDATYSMKMNGKESEPTNDASLIHSTDPNCDPTTNPNCPVDTVPVDHKVTVHTFSIKLKNVLRSNESALTGSQFTISKENTSGAPTPIEFVKHAENDKSGVYTTTDPSGTADKITTLDVSSLNDATKGTLDLSGLGTGTYVVQQTRAAQNPSLRGVMLPKFKIVVEKKDASSTDPSGTVTAVKVSVVQDAWKLVDSTVGTDGVKVTNVPSVIQLPLTGGAGIILAVIVILAIAALFGGTVVLKRRHEATRRRV